MDEPFSDAKVPNPIFQEIARFRAIIFDALLKPHSMTMSQGWVLVHLWYRDGQRQSDLALGMDVATVTVSKLIDKLEANGFVERRSDAGDRRSNRVFVTQPGTAVVKEMTKIIGKVDEIANENISEADLAVAMDVLKQIRKNLKLQLSTFTAPRSPENE